jgi:DNA-binding MarR family transcriptional regulator
MSGKEPARLAAQLERLVLLLVHPRGQFHEVEEHPLSWTQRLALAVAVDESPLRLGALAARMGTTDATASRTVDSLSSIGLLRREPDDTDGRGVLVLPTPAAVNLLAERRQRLVDALACGLSRLPEDDEARLVTLLSELNQVLEASVQSPQAPADG